MYPILIEIPGLGLRVWSYQLFQLLAVAVCMGIGPRWARRLEGLDPRRVWHALLLLGLAPWIGGRAHYVLTHWGLFAHRPLDALEIWSGIHAGGAIIAVVVAAPWAVRRAGLSVGRFADAFTPTVGVGIALARLGCFLHGCCKGTACAWPWGLAFPYTIEPAVVVHPLQLYFAAAGLLLTLGALRLYPRKRYDGQVALQGLLFFAATSAVLEPLRADSPESVHWGPVSQLQWVALGLTAVPLVLLALRRYRGSSENAAPEVLRAS